MPARVVESREANERQLLTEAHRALTAGDAEGAMVQLERLSTEFPDGQLAEERESLKIRGLVALKRSELARPSFAAFEKAYPGSMFLSGLRALLSQPADEEGPFFRGH